MLEINTDYIFNKREDFLRLVEMHLLYNLNKSLFREHPSSIFSYAIRASYNIPEHMTSIEAFNDFKRYLHESDSYSINPPSWLTEKEINEVAPISL